MRSQAKPTLGSSARRAALAAGALLLIPAVAMLFNADVHWGPEDFLVAGALLFLAGFAWQLTAVRTGGIAYRVGMAVAILALLVLVWSNLAVGVIGAEGNPVNMLYFSVPVVGFLSAVIAEFRPRGMVLAMLAAALTQLLVTLTAFVTNWGNPWSEPVEVILVNGFFIVLFCAAAMLFRRSAS